MNRPSQNHGSQNEASNDQGLLADTAGGPTMEWTLLLGFMALPAYWIIQMLLSTLTAYYGLMTTINAMPLP